MTRFLFLVLLVGHISQALAATVYIRDMLYVPLRGGQSTEYRILHKGLRSGTPLEELEVYPDSGYTRVRTEDGMEGYLQTQYLTDEPIARDLLAATRQKLVDLEARYQQSLLRLQEATADKETLTRENTALAQSLAATERALVELQTLSADVLNINDTNESRAAEQVELLTQIDELVALNDGLAGSQNQRWFLSGAGVILLGLLFGFWLARRLYRQESNW